MNNYKIVNRDVYKTNKKYYIECIKELFNNDNSKIANIKEFEKHLDFIFSSNDNDAILILNFEGDKIISMVNFLQYDNVDNLWCLFSLFTLKSKRRMGYAEDILKNGINEIKSRKAKLLISGIEEDNIKSIKLHEKAGFKCTNKMWDEIVPGFPSNHIAYTLTF